jgi:hypothetical protein
MSRQKAHDGLGHNFVGVPVASCLVEGCTETRTWSPYPVDFGMRNQIGGGDRWYSTQLGEDPYGILDPTLGRYAEEGEVPAE